MDTADIFLVIFLVVLLVTVLFVGRRKRCRGCGFPPKGRVTRQYWEEHRALHYKKCVK